MKYMYFFRKAVDKDDEAVDNGLPTYLPTYRAERSFALLFCQAFFAKIIPKNIKDRHVHGSSPPVNAQVFFAYPAAICSSPDAVLTLNSRHSA
ncbi:MAG: hypothetical protein GX811_01995 [Lentisphaerae bacterium]|nr:hypothetical protein [Lentisphaerota bacterium]